MKQNIYMIGIKGAGMSALAQVLHDIGYIVSGSDIDKYYFTQEQLEARNIEIRNFSSDNIKEEHLIISSSAYNEDNVEIKECLKRGLKFYRYHEFLGIFLEEYISIAISGTHGKTSTTGLLGNALSKQKNSSLLVGDGTGCGHKNSDFFVFEACEYKNHFLNYQPDCAIITNIDFDHPDYFSSLQEVKKSFQNFVNQVKKGLIVCGDDKNIQDLKIDKKAIYYGLNETNQLRATSLKVENDKQIFEVYYLENFLGSFEIKQFGEHSVLNALAVIGISLLIDLDLNGVQHSFLDFRGVKRRFNEEKVGNKILIDDYAHHPTEIEATINAVKTKYPNKKIVAIFQPHTYSRTVTFKQDFVNALNGANKSYVCPVFSSVREKEGDFDLNSFVDDLDNGEMLLLDNMYKVINENENENTVYLFMGAGNVNDYLHIFKSYLK